MRKQKPSSPEFGATGRYPLGRVSPDDEGELRFGIAARSGRVLIDFGKPVFSLGLDPDQADELAESITKNASIARDQMKFLESVRPQG